MEQRKALLVEVGGESHNAHLSSEVSYCQDEAMQLITSWISPRAVKAFTAPILEHHPLVGSPAAR